LFEMLTGRTPFAGDDALETLMAHVNAPVPTFAQIAPDLAVPPDVEALVRDGLVKKPGERIASARDYIRRIEPLLGREAIAPARPARATALQPTGVDPHAETKRLAESKPPRRRWRPVAAGTIAIAGLLAALCIQTNVGAVVGSAVADRLATPSEQAPTMRPAPEGAAIPQPAPAMARPPQARRDARLEAALQTLERGRTCLARRAAVMQLRRLGDPRAIPGLKRARVRFRGVRGARSNENACLTTAADAAIAQLENANREDQAQARRDQTRAR
jgi:serine/threonine-protein kinase